MSLMKPLFTFILCCLYSGVFGQIIAPDTVCAGTTVSFTTTVSAVTYSWDFNATSVVQTVSATSPYNTTGGTPTWTTFNDDGGNYYSFTVDYTTGHITRLSFGTSIYSTPVVTDLGTFGGTGGNTEGIDIVKDDVTGNWYGLVVNYSQMIVLSFGASLSLTPTATVTTYAALQWPHQVTIKKYLGNWSAFVANRNGNIVRFDFGGSLTSAPVVTTIPNVGGVTNPCNFSLYEQAGNWYMIITNLINGSLSRYEFGTNLLNNTPTGTLLAPPGSFTLPRPVNLLTDCENHLIGYMVTEPGQLYKLDFGGDITTTPVITALGASGTIDVNSATPCAYNDSFSFLLVNYSGSIVKYYPMYFTPADFVNYYTSSQSYTFATAGTYSVSLFCDMGYPSGPSVYCKNIVVQACASCMANSLTINTGYDPISGAAITPGGNGATPVIDPHWILSAVSPAVSSAIAATPIPGLIEVTPANNANVIYPAALWAINPSGIAGGWISCLNSNTYNDGLTGSPYNMTLGRPFRMCTDDSIKLTLYIANDNYISSTDIDGVPLAFSQPAVASYSYLTMFTFFTQTIYLTAGTHTLHVVVNNFNEYPPDPPANPTGLDIYGTVSSVSGLNSLVSESSASCNAYICGGTICDVLTMPDSLRICLGDTATIHTLLSGPDSVLSYNWSPATGLSSTTILDPVLTGVSTSGWYDLTVQSLIPGNLVVNGDFSAGGTGFTTGYILELPAPISVPGYYAVDTNPNIYDATWPAIGDHTSGTGNMLIVDGAPSSGISFWCETLSVNPNTNYIFSLWITLLHDPLPGVQLTINGINISTFSTSVIAGEWTQYQLMWNSGTATSANICMYDVVTGAYGNDFAIDDISFRQLCTIKDSVYLKVTISDTAYTHTDTTSCSLMGAVILNAPSTYHKYIWSTGDTTASITVSGSGLYWLAALSYCNMLVDTFHVTAIPLPFVSLGNDTSVCEGGAITLSSPLSSGNYLWSTGSTAPSIIVSGGGLFVLSVTNNGCTSSDTIQVLQIAGPVLNLGRDTILCKGDMLTLTSGAIPSLWSTGTNATDITVTNSGTYWASITNSCGTVSDSIKVDFEPCDLYFPSGFTPNDDGRNDIARAVGDLGMYRNYSLSIYNRFGQRVFYTEDIYSGWDGVFNGVKQDIGTFYYMIFYTLEGNRRMMKGDITLIR